ncbi:toprim domain-containing protein [Intestinibacillus sp. Marseille-P6563]|uniref:toprim domain-containing protein n=1 Tax=Intestinibacillus sp. Marseille-P6563 TaxID=2364792 RepID=UPI000F06D70A|nr:DUF4093 domain-containing protein [Intestinibacillus sp. Marseille-P6563]
MIQIKEAILVEGRYDIQTLRQMVDTVVLETGGFRIFKDRERLEMIRKIAARRGILILTDSDGAGFTIRNFLRGAIPKDQVKHAYIPEIQGKERRKRHSSKEGLLGVEGMSQDILQNALERAGATILGEESGQALRANRLEKADLYAMGLSGQPDSAQKRKRLLKALGLPQYLSANALLDFMNAVSNREEVLQTFQQISQEDIDNPHS